jgi:hypothetical protein
MKIGMTLGHKCLVTQFSTKEVLYYDATKTRPTYICTLCSRAIWVFGGWVVYCTTHGRFSACFHLIFAIYFLIKAEIIDNDAGSYLQLRRQTDENWHDSGPQKFRQTIFDKRGAILWWLFEELLKVFTWLVEFPYQLSIISALIRKYPKTLHKKLYTARCYDTVVQHSPVIVCRII